MIMITIQVYEPWHSKAEGERRRRRDNDDMVDVEEEESKARMGIDELEAAWNMVLALAEERWARCVLDFVVFVCDICIYVCILRKQGTCGNR